MKFDVRRARYIGSALGASQYPKDNLPHIVMVGKSNVGKSSLINCLANNSKLAYTSSQPGKTRLINFYNIDEKFHLVDLPGYGYARIAKREQQSWGKMMDEYFLGNPYIALLIHVLDIRHYPTTEDIQMYEWIDYYGFPLVCVATKSDKLGKTKWKPQVKQIRRKMGLLESIPAIPFSASTGQGRDILLKYIQLYLDDYHTQKD